MLLVRKFLCIRLESQRELDGRVMELSHGSEGNVKSRRYAAERQADREAVVLDLEVPEAVLDDDRHLVREALEQVFRDGDTRHPRLERDVEMMVAGEGSRRFDLAQNTAHDRPQCVLHDLVVRDQAFGSLVAHGFVVAGERAWSSGVSNADRCDPTL